MDLPCTQVGMLKKEPADVAAERREEQRLANAKSRREQQEKNNAKKRMKVRSTWPKNWPQNSQDGNQMAPFFSAVRLRSNQWPRSSGNHRARLLFSSALWLTANNLPHRINKGNHRAPLHFCLAFVAHGKYLATSHQSGQPTGAIPHFFSFEARVK